MKAALEIEVMVATERYYCPPVGLPSGAAPGVFRKFCDGDDGSAWRSELPAKVRLESGTSLVVSWSSSVSSVLVGGI